MQREEDTHPGPNRPSVPPTGQTQVEVVGREGWKAYATGSSPPANREEQGKGKEWF